MAIHRRQNSYARRTTRCTTFNKAAAYRLRVPIIVPKGVLLLVLIYARFSTDEQNPRSIDDQVAYCREFLRSLGITNFKIEVRSDEGISGEVVSRPGINAVFEGCRERRWDLVLAEDASRLYRHETACGELIETAVDAGVRVICVNDYLDTAEDEEWEDRLHEALRHHAKSNRYTSRRIKRTHSALWEMGAAVGMLKPGYRRKASTAATAREPAQGPHYDEVDPKWAPVIKESFERIAAGNSPAAVAQYLTKVGLPKSVNALSSEWNEKNAIALIRRPDYRGTQTFRGTVSKKKYRTGKRAQVPNDPDDVLTREMPDLRIVSDKLWFQANDAVDGRITAVNRNRGQDHPLWGVPRDSRTPLSEILICGICGERMHVIGANGYRCRNAKTRAQSVDACWNRATAKCEISHNAIQQSLQEQVGKIRDVDAQQSMVAGVNQLLACEEQDSADRVEKRGHLEEQKRELEAKLNHLIDLVEVGTGSSDSLLARIDRREEELARLHANLEALDDDEIIPLSVRELDKQLEEFDSRLQMFDRSVKCDLRQLVGTIRAVPHQQFGCDKVVLIGRFRFNPLALLPARVRLALQQRQGDQLIERLPEKWRPVDAAVELFERAAGPKYWKPALECQGQGLGLTAIGKELGTTKRKAHLGVQYGKQLRAAGLSDPFIELTAPPANASRWGPRRSAAELPLDP